MSTPKTLTITESHQLLDALIHRDAPRKSFCKGIRNHTMALLMLDAGLRVGEVVALQMSDLYYGMVPVQNLLIRPEIAKTKTERTVPLSTRLRNSLGEYFKECPWFTRLAGQAYVFKVWLRDAPLTTRQVERIIRAAAMKSIGRPVNPHVLRHTFASKLMRVTDMRTVQELLGHKKMSSTQIYTHPNEDDKKKAIKSIESDLSGPENIAPPVLASPDVPNRLDAPGTNRHV